MKVFTKSCLGILIVATCIVSCKKNKNDGLPAPVNSIVSSSTLAQLKKYGTVINEGTTPPDITGIFMIEPNVCTFDNSSETLLGQTFASYLFKFSNQNDKNFTVRFDYASTDDGVDDKGSDSTATFISGKNDLFTVFAQSKGSEYGIDYTTLDIVSGEISADGVKNLQITKYLQQKGEDPNSLLTEVGTTRIFHDSDNLSDRQTGTTILSLVKKASQLKSIAHPSYLAR